MTIRSIALRCLFVVSLVLPAGTSFAGDLSAVFSGKSYHLGSEKDWNENNYGFGVEFEFATASRWKPVLMANGFRDSVDNMSYMAGAGLHRSLYVTRRLGGLYVDVGLNAFVMTRDNVNDGRPFPGALPSVSIGNRLIGVNAAYLPRIAVKEITADHRMDKNLRGIVFVQFKINVSELAARH